MLRLGVFFAALLAAFPAFAAVTIGLESVVSLMIYIVVAGLILWLLFWLVGYCGLPEPFNKVAKVILAVVAVLILISLLLSFAGHPILNFR